MFWSNPLSTWRLSSLRMTDRAVRVIQVATDEAQSRRHGSISPEHVLIAFTKVGVGPAVMALTHLGFDLTQESQAVAEMLDNLPVRSVMQRKPKSEGMEQFIDEAKNQSRLLHHHYIGTEHLALAILAVPSNPAQAFLNSKGISYDRYKQAVLEVLN